MCALNIDQRPLEKRHFVEDVGVLFEDFGLPRMAGRIIGYLLICDPPHQTAGEIVEAVGGSKGSVSSMTQLLIQIGAVDRISLPGKRGTCYRVKAGAHTDLLHRRMDFLTNLRIIAGRGLALIDDDNIQQRRRLQQMQDLCAFIEKELSRLLEHWKNKHTQKPV